MLDPRIYRTGFVAVALAVVVVAFSLLDQQGPLTPSLAPDAFNGQSAYATMTSLARGNPDRRPGSTGDDDVAAYVAGRLRQYGYGVSTHVFTGHTAQGSRTLETVTGVRTGSANGSVVVVSHRDSLSSPDVAGLSGTATLLEMARVLAGETQQRSIVLVSTSGSAGLAGATDLARTITGPVDAVIALGDLAGVRTHEPFVVPWGEGANLAPPLLRNTLAAALSAQAGLRPGGTSFGGQLVHLAFPLSLSDQAPFNSAGIPAVTLSLSGDRPPAPREATSPGQMNAAGRTVLEAVNAVDGAPALPAPTPYLIYSGKVLPLWAIKLLVLALMLPVLLAGVDGVARVRRRGHSLGRGLTWVLARGAPFMLAALIVLAAGAVGALPAAPPGPVPAGAVPLHGGAVAVMVLAALALGGAFYAAVRGSEGDVRDPRPSSEPGALDPGRSIAVLIVMCLATLAIWLVNPFAAVLLVPALHLWTWVVEPALRLRPPLSALFVAAGLAAPALAIVYYASVQGLGPLGVLWNGTLLVAGGQLGLPAVLEWSLILGCLVSVVTIAARSVRQPRPDEAPVTVRGPVTYAGPGSLGGTESALRR